MLIFLLPGLVSCKVLNADIQLRLERIRARVYESHALGYVYTHTHTPHTHTHTHT
jgi:hypothetical protein